MKRLTAILVTITGLLPVCQGLSQNTNSPPPIGHHGWHGMSHKEKLNRLSEELNLSEQQKPQVQAVFEQMRQQIQAAAQEAKSNADTQLQGILTPEQYQKLQSIWQEQHHHWSGSNTNENSGQ